MTREESELAWLRIAVCLGPVQFGDGDGPHSTGPTSKNKRVAAQSCGHGFSWGDRSSPSPPLEQHFSGNMYHGFATTLGGSPSDRVVTAIVRRRKYKT